MRTNKHTHTSAMSWWHNSLVGVCEVRLSLSLSPNRISYLNPTYHHLQQKNHDASFLWHSLDLSDSYLLQTTSGQMAGNWTHTLYEVKSEPRLVPSSSVLTHLYWCLEAIDISLINGATIQPLLLFLASGDTTESFCIVLSRGERLCWFCVMWWFKNVSVHCCVVVRILPLGGVIAWEGPNFR